MQGRKIWILWGMWPHASCRLYERILRISNEEYGINTNHGYPHLVIDSIPVRDLVENQGALKETLNSVRNEANLLRQFGCEILAMACNTMHLYANEISQWLGVDFVSMIEVTTKEVMEGWHSTIGILGTATTLRCNLYDGYFKNFPNVTLLKPSEEGIGRLVRAIENAIGEWPTDEDVRNLENEILWMKERGASAVVLGCTELPIVAERISWENISWITIVDPLNSLAKELCRKVLK